MSFTWPWQAEAFASGLKIGGASDIVIDKRLPAVGVAKNAEDDNGWTVMSPRWGSVLFNQGLRLADPGGSTFSLYVNGDKIKIDNLDSEIEEHILFAAIDLSFLTYPYVTRCRINQQGAAANEDDALVLEENDPDFIRVIELIYDILDVSALGRIESIRDDSPAASDAGPSVHRIIWGTRDMGTITVPIYGDDATAQSEAYANIASDDFYRESSPKCWAEVFDDTLSRLLMSGTQWCFASYDEAFACLCGIKVAGGLGGGFLDPEAAMLDDSVGRVVPKQLREANKQLVYHRRFRAFDLGLRLAGAAGASLCKVDGQVVMECEGLKSVRTERFVRDGLIPLCDAKFNFSGELLRAVSYIDPVYDLDDLFYDDMEIEKDSNDWSAVSSLGLHVYAHQDTRIRDSQDDNIGSTVGTA